MYKLFVPAVPNAELTATGLDAHFTDTCVGGTNREPFCSRKMASTIALGEDANDCRSLEGLPSGKGTSTEKLFPRKEMGAGVRAVLRIWCTHLRMHQTPTTTPESFRPTHPFFTRPGESRTTNSFYHLYMALLSTLPFAPLMR